MQNKTILVINCHLNKWGAERSMCALIRYLQQTGCRVVLLLSKHGPIEELLFGIEYYITPIWGSATMSSHSLKREISNHIHFVWNSYASTRKALSLLNKKGINPDIIYTNTIVPSLGTNLAQALKVPHIIHIREITDEDFPFRFFFGKKSYMRYVNKSLTKAICISDAVKNKFYPYFGEKAIRIYNGLPIPLAHNCSKLSNNDGKTHIIVIARLSPEKNIMSVVKAANTIKNEGVTDFVVELYGDGPERNEIATYVSENALEHHVIFHGYQNSIDIASYDIAIMASNAEAFGRTTVEYMMNRVPVIGKNSGATKEIIENQVSGLLYNDIHELVYCIKILISDISLRTKFSKAAYLRATKLFEEKRCFEQVRSTLLSHMK